MTMNLIVAAGDVSFFIYDEQAETLTSLEVGNSNYVRICVKAGLWMAFRGNNKDLNLILNIASCEHNPAEAMNVPLHTFPLD